MTEDTTALAPHSGPQTALQASSFLSVSGEDRTALYKLAQSCVASGIYPNVQNPDAAFLVMLKGADLGLAPQEALSSIYLIRGKAHVGYTVLASLLRRHSTYDYKVTDLTPKGCTVTFTRAGEDIGSYTFTMEDAGRAGLTGGRDSNWSKYPTTMLFARALSLGQRIYCPDLTSSTVYVEAHGETEVPLINVTPTKRETRATIVEATEAPAPLFGAVEPAPVGEMTDVDEWVEWAKDQGLTPDQAEEVLTATCSANDGEFMHDDFKSRVEALAS